MTPREPTVEECTANTEIVPKCFALWYPQMGGYSGKAIAVWSGGCWELFIWHDGDFPFSDGDVDGWTDTPRVPVNIHHCDSSQFVRFGHTLQQCEQRLTALLAETETP